MGLPIKLMPSLMFFRSLKGVIDNINQSSLYFVLKTEDFDTCSWKNDINNFEGISMENLTSNYSLKQLIFEPTHPLPISSSSIE